ncbi:hypothetical protein FNW02_35170 [Komarekiella sp. 'clone 1']|uniref:Uncharacterized protein n=1 Tax=Komarekiella delphini-convector SJRDD-AB1 TaxID=2593771 RepID=A0AA40VV68_9NOST|nr:hypothetical protein [Komarekiella delphini-convector]MBD6620852.1 hypothetical protein [Komarekiella delphini-convector SJRDD-AB1]
MCKSKGDRPSCKQRDRLYNPVKGINIMAQTTIALQELTALEISFYDHEIYCGDKLIAAITYDSDDLTQPWVVMINNSEEFRANTWAKCYRYICIHHKDGSLPVQQPETPTATDNEIQCQIAIECEKYEFDLLDDGIYHHDQKLGEVGCTNGRWWVIRASSEHQQKVPCDSALDAVWSLSMVQVTCCEDLLDRPFETLTVEEWRRLVEYQPELESRELVTA